MTASFLEDFDRLNIGNREIVRVTFVLENKGYCRFVEFVEKNINFYFCVLLKVYITTFRISPDCVIKIHSIGCTNKLNRKKKILQSEEFTLYQDLDRTDRYHLKWKKDKLVYFK